MNRPPAGPPRWADRFLEWFCHPDLLEEIQGDIHELYEMREAKWGSKRARRRFTWDVLRSFRLSTVKNFDLLISPDMLKINVRIAFRQMLKQKVFTFIKIGGFALGMAACLLISLYIKDETSYDQHYQEGDRLYRMLTFNEGLPDSWQSNVFFPAPLAEALLEDYPEFEATARISPGGLFGGGSNTLRRADQQENFFEEGFILADPELLDVLEVPIVRGEQEAALVDPQTIVISERKAEQYFAGEDPIGKFLIINDEVENPYRVSGVMANIPDHSHLAPIDFLVTLSGVEFWEGEQSYWRANNYHTYVRLVEGTDVEQLETELLSLIDKYYLPSTIAEGVQDAEEEARKMSFGLQPVQDIYLKSGDIMDLLPHGDIRFVRLLGAIVLFILALAIINFVNLSTAKSANRAREVGMRKVVGSQRGQLIQQFLTESIVISSLALVLSVVLAGLLLPYFNQLAGKELSLPWLAWWFLPGAALVGILLGVIAGSYPALFLSTFKPIDVLRGHLSRGAKSSSLRNSLVVFQFTTSVILIVGTLVVYQQMNYILNKQLGFQKDQVVILQGANTLGEKVHAFKEEIQRLPAVQSVSVGDYLPIDGTQRNSNRFWADNGEQVIGQFWLVDHDYVQTLGMEIVQGRDFSRDRSTDSTAMIINEAMARQLGVDDPLGRQLNNGPDWNIIGVVKDFHWMSLRDEILPVCLVLEESPYMISVKASAGEMDQLLGQLEASWDEFVPNQAFQYSFLDQEFASMYEDIFRTRDVFMSFALLAVIIACLGLFALSAYLTEQRHKEISTRKVLGASTLGIVGMLGKDYLLLVIVALAIGLPISWYAMNTWLADFSFRIDLGWPIFVLAAVISILIALGTISYQTIRAARLNPAEFLRSSS